MIIHIMVILCDQLITEDLGCVIVNITVLLTFFMAEIQSFLIRGSRIALFIRCMVVYVYGRMLVIRITFLLFFITIYAFYSFFLVT